MSELFQWRCITVQGLDRSGRMNDVGAGGGGDEGGPLGRCGAARDPPSTSRPPAHRGERVRRQPLRAATNPPCLASGRPRPCRCVLTSGRHPFPPLPVIMVRFWLEGWRRWRRLVRGGSCRRDGEGCAALHCFSLLALRMREGGAGEVLGWGSQDGPVVVFRGGGACVPLADLWVVCPPPPSSGTGVGAHAAFRRTG